MRSVLTLVVFGVVVSGMALGCESTETTSNGSSEIAATSAPLIDGIDSNEHLVLPTPINDELAALYDIELSYSVVGMFVTVLAEIVGGPDSHPDMYCQGFEFRWGDRVFGSAGPDCMPYKEGLKFPRHHEIDHLFTEPGDIDFSFKYGELELETITVQIGS